MNFIDDFLYYYFLLNLLAPIFLDPVYTGLKRLLMEVVSSGSSSFMYLYNKSLCPNRIYGCQDQFPSSELVLHKLVCPLRAVLCPLCANWKGSATALKSHVANIGHQVDMVYFKLTIREKSFEIIHSGEEMYVMGYSCNRRLGYFWVNLKYPGSINYAKRRYFKLTLKSKNGIEYHVQSQVQPVKNWEINQNSSLQIDLSMLDIAIPIATGEEIEVKLEIKNRTPFFPTNTIKPILENVTCPLCRKFMDGPIIQTYVGHSICDTCNKEAERMDDTRNYALESFCKKLSKYVNKEVTSIEGELLDEVECSVCLDHMSRPIRICVSGHSVCGYCRPKLSKCPVCRQRFTTVRNSSLESICDKLHYSCMYADNGCPFMSPLDDLASHENSCSFNLFECPFKSITNCVWRGKYTDINFHSCEIHKAAV